MPRKNIRGVKIAVQVEKEGPKSQEIESTPLSSKSDSSKKQASQNKSAASEASGDRKRKVGGSGISARSSKRKR